MKVLLISANTEAINMPVLPIGLACVARAAEIAGHDVTQVNLPPGASVPEILRESIAAAHPDVIGISVRNIDDQVSAAPRFLLAPVREIVGVCRRHTSAKIVLGGAGYSIFPGPVLEYLGADMGIQGDGEKAFTDLLSVMAAGGDLSAVPGLHCPRLGIANLPETGVLMDALPLPLPGRHIRLPENIGNEPLWLPFQTRRGCPMRCSYCSTASIEGTVIRRRSINAVVDAIGGFAAAGFDHLFFVDNTFNLPPDYAMALCEKIRFAELKIRWRCILYPWKIAEALAAAMAAAGCVEVSLGFESGADTMLQAMKKRFHTEDVRQASDLLKAHHIRRTGFLLLGGPGETRRTVLQSLAFADALGLDMVKVTVGLRIYPKTALASHARAAGVVRPDDTLLLPKFYIEPGMAEWLRETLDAWIASRPNWIY